MDTFRESSTVLQHENDPFFSSRSGKLSFYHELSFIRELSEAALCARVLDRINASDECWMTGEIRFFVKRLAWDSEYFQQETFRIEAILYEKTKGTRLLSLFSQFVEGFMQKNSGCRLFMEVPVEDSEVIQGLTSAGMRVVESRVIHFIHPLADVSESAWRIAQTGDAERLGAVARKMINPFDRVHADILFPDALAGGYLDTYTRACVEGFTDAVIVPDEPGVPSKAFVAVNLRKDEWSWNPWNTAQIVLTAVDSDTNRGWYKRLVNAAIRFVQLSGAESLFNTTQLGNRAVIHTLENAGFRFGGSRFIISI
jgi:dTDP-4-amino-4,6-dideoxy-D-galactose acyltransferase